MALQDHAQIGRLRAEVQQLANNLHQAKINLDFHSNWVGLNIAEVRERWRVSKRDNPVPSDVMSREYNEAARAYREAKKNYWQAKGRLEYLVLKSTTQKQRQQSIKAAVEGARDHMNQTFGPRIMQAAAATGEFHLSEHPEIVKELESSINDAINQARRNPSQESVAALLETIAAAYEAGYDDVQPGHATSSMAAARQVLDKAYEKFLATLKNAGIKY